MSDNICYVDAYARSIQARLRAVEPPAAEGRGAMLLLDRTVFYPGGGGQPADRGLLRTPDGSEWQVVAARRQGDEIWHELAPGTEPPAARGLAGPGASVIFTADLDWERRFRLMRTHTALHALCGVVWRDYGALVTGGNMEPGSGRMDFEFERMSGELVGAIERAVNEELLRAREVRVNVLPREEAFAIPDLIRTKVNLLPEGIEQIRTIEIVGLDLQADGGTHVSNTREVGTIRVTGYESKGRINKRIRMELVAPT
jgi:misacylated tRNA(Ala) deacylase